MIPSHPNHHTQIMIDLMGPNNLDKPPTLQDFIERERDYDIGFYAAWEKGFQLDSLTNSQSFLKTLDNIQFLAMSHLPPVRPVPGGYQKIRGRATEPNYFGLAKGVCSDERGLRDIIKKIWIDQEEDMHLVVKTQDLKTYYRLTKNSFGVLGETPMDVGQENRSKSLNQISDILIPIYNAGLCEREIDPVVIFSTSTKEDREKKALSIIDRYFELITLEASSSNKMRIIASTIRDLEQLHLYYDGNGRSLYILANVLFVQNHIKPFYPKNMCMFDGNSIEQMEKELIDGQRRFSTLFGNLSDLNMQLKNYNDRILELKTLIREHPAAFQKSFAERNLNLLFRQSATNPKYISLLGFLLANAKILCIDVFSKGAKSGSAFDIATKFKNAAGIELLESRLS